MNRAIGQGCRRRLDFYAAYRRHQRTRQVEPRQALEGAVCHSYGLGATQKLARARPNRGVLVQAHGGAKRGPAAFRGHNALLRRQARKRLAGHLQEHGAWQVRVLKGVAGEIPASVGHGLFGTQGTKAGLAALRPVLRHAIEHLEHALGQ